ncbi:MAG: copper homeostasis membrane protein CopD [Pararhizobium sp.]
MNEGPHDLLIACRFLHDAAAMFLWGAFGFLATLVPKNLAEETGRRLGGARVLAIALVVLAVVASLPAETAMIADGWSSALDPQTLSSLLFATSLGRAGMIDAVAALLLLASLALPARMRLRAVVLPAALALASLGFTGHAMIDEGALGALHRANDILHVFASGAWVGALVPLAVILTRAGGDRATEARLALERFSTAGRWAVALTVLTGLGNTLLVVGHLPSDPGSPYQMLLVAKIAIVLLRIALASLNQFRFVPRITRNETAALRAIRRGAMAEVALGTLVILLVAVFGMMDPT